MPVTARLSKRFYDRLGDDIANELVDWFNSVDATYRLDLKDINELNFARFDAKLGQRFAEQDARLDRRFAEQDAKFDKRFAEQDAKLDKRFAEQDAKLEIRFAGIDRRFGDVDRRLSGLDQRFATFETRIIKWMFAFWVTTLLALLALR